MRREVARRRRQRDSYRLRPRLSRLLYPPGKDPGHSALRRGQEFATQGHCSCQKNGKGSLTMPLKVTKFSVTDHLKTPGKQIAYIEAALDEDDPSFIAVAIGDVAKARGISQFARDTGLSREVIYNHFGRVAIQPLKRSTKP